MVEPRARAPEGSLRDRPPDRGAEQFQNVASRISRVLGAADASTLDVAVATALENFGIFAEVDCAFVTLMDENTIITDEWNWTRPGLETTAPAIGSSLSDVFRSALEFLKAGHTVPVADLNAIDLSPSERRLANENGIGASVIAPVRVGPTLLGVVGLHVYGQPRAWTPATVSQVELFAEIVVQAVVRTRQRGALEHANARARRIAQYVPSPLLILDRDRVIIWVSASFDATTVADPGTAIGRPIEALFHPDDAGLLAGVGRLDTSSPPERIASSSAARQQLGSVVARLATPRGWRWAELEWQAITEEAGEDETVVLLRDVHDREVRASELLHANDHDALTGVLSRNGLARALDRLNEQGRSVTAAFCDVNGFKSWNDRHGHDAGDAVLRLVADALTAWTRSGDLVARIGGDEFLVVVVDPAEADASTVGERLGHALAAVTLAETGEAISVAVGVSSVGPAADIDRLREQADRSMYRVKGALRPSPG